MALTGSGVRDTARVLGISAQTVMGELKKNRSHKSAPTRAGHVARCPGSGLAGVRRREVIICTAHVRHNKGQRWLWWVEDAANGQLVLSQRN